MLSVVTWTGAVSTDFADGGNWLAIDYGQPAFRPPVAGDDVVYRIGIRGGGGGGIPFYDCDGMVGDPAGPYNSVTVMAGFGTVTLDSGFETKALHLVDGTIDQPTSGTDITVLGDPDVNAENADIFAAYSADFDWTGGTLNSTTNLATVYISGTGTVAPTNWGEVTTGSDLEFGTQAISTTVNVEPGTVAFNNGAEVVAGAGAAVTINATNADVLFKNKDAITYTNTTMILGSGTGVTVIGPNSWSGDGFKLLIDGGTLEVKNNATVHFGYQGPFLQARSDILMTHGIIDLHSGSTIKTRAFPMTMQNGYLYIVADSPVGETAPAKLDTSKFQFTGGTLRFTGHKWTFQVTGDVDWTGGGFWTRVDVAPGGTADFWQIDGTLTIGVDRTVTVDAKIENWIPGQVIPTRDILIGKNGIVRGQGSTVTVESHEGPALKIDPSDEPPTGKRWRLVKQ